MRIISGKYGGRTLQLPKNFRARPTTDMAREGLFNILSNHFDFSEVSVLDLFAGTGSIGLEFLSRGARHADFVDNNYLHSVFIKKAISTLKAENAVVLRADFFRILPRINKQYEIIFADPPYDMQDFTRVAEVVMQSNILAKGGWFILEHPGRYSFSGFKGCFDHRKYGSVNFSFFQSE